MRKLCNFDFDLPLNFILKHFILQADRVKDCINCLADTKPSKLVMYKTAQFTHPNLILNNSINAQHSHWFRIQCIQWLNKSDNNNSEKGFGCRTKFRIRSQTMHILQDDGFWLGQHKTLQTATWYMASNMQICAIVFLFVSFLIFNTTDVENSFRSSNWILSS